LTTIFTLSAREEGLSGKVVKYDIKFLKFLLILKKYSGIDMEKRVRDELNILKNIIIRTVPVEKMFLFL